MKPESVDITKLPKKVSQPYELTRNFTFNIHEARILIRVLQQIKQHQKVKLNQQIDLDNNVVMRFRPKDLTVSNDLDKVYKALKTIREKTIILNGTSFHEGKKVGVKIITGIINEATYSDNNSFVDVKLNAEWYTFLTDLSKGYTPYLSNIGFETSNAHFIRIYQYICHWFDKGKMEGIELSEQTIRNEFKIGDKYGDLRKIVARIIEPCKKELDAFADKSFNFTLNRVNPEATRGKGAKIKSITMKFYQIKEEKTVSTYDPKRAASKIGEFQRMYELDETDTMKLGALMKRYDFAYISTIEYENRKWLKEQKSFIETLHKLILRRK